MTPGLVAHQTNRDVVSITGEDAFSYLQSQVSQDLADFKVGQSVASLLLSPAGKVDALVRITRIGDESFEVDVDSGFGELVMQRLRRFKIRVAAELELAVRPIIAIRGDDAAAMFPTGRPTWWMDGRAVDLFAVDNVASVDLIDEAEFESLRVDSGWPKMGAEIVETSIPAELGVIPITVNFGKGCYPGQELVERMDSRQSQSPRQLCRVANNNYLIGQVVVVDGVEAATITSVGDEFALAFVKRGVDPARLSALPVSGELP